MGKVVDYLRRLHPSKELPKESGIWTIIAIALMGFALWVVFTAKWQTEGFFQAGYKDGKLVEVIEVFKACRFGIAPNVTAVICAIFIYGALLARRYIRPASNLYALLLVAMNVVFVASLVESFLPAKSVCLFRMLGWEVLTFSPLKLLVFVILLSWLGMRALSGFSIILLILAFWSRTQELDVTLGFWGSAYLLCGFLSFVVQCRLPYMVPDGGLGAAFLQDFGWVRAQVQQNLKASVAVTENAAAAAMSIAAPTLVSRAKSVLEKPQSAPQIKEG